MGYRTALLSYPVTLNVLASRSYPTLCILNRDLRQTTWRHGRCTGIGSCTKLWSISIRWALKHWMRIYLRSKWSWYSGMAVIESDDLLLETCLLQTVSMGHYTCTNLLIYSIPLWYTRTIFKGKWVNPSVMRLSKMLYNIAGYKISIVMLYMDSAMYNNYLKI